MDDKFDKEGALWSLANSITGFAVAQALVFVYLLADSQFVNEVGNRIAAILICSLLVIMGVVYALAIQKIPTFLENSEHKAVWQATTRGRIAGVAIFHVLCLIGYVAVLVES